jgi:hypothetical protein
MFLFCSYSKENNESRNQNSSSRLLHDDSNTARKSVTEYNASSLVASSTRRASTAHSKARVSLLIHSNLKMAETLQATARHNLKRAERSPHFL